MEEVARAAHISRPGLYFLFSSKETLFRAAVTQALERDITAVERVLADGSRPLSRATRSKRSTSGRAATSAR